MHELIPPAVNFTFLAGLLFFLLRKPVAGAIAARRDNIKVQVEEARAQKAEAEKRYREFSQKLSAFEREAADILEHARRDAEATRGRIIKEAQQTAERIVKDAESTAHSNLQEFKDQIRKETIAKAIELAEKVIRDRLSADDHRRIVNEYVEKV